jgi:hypothetical protein
MRLVPLRLASKRRERLARLGKSLSSAAILELQERDPTSPAQLPEGVGSVITGDVDV